MYLEALPVTLCYWWYFFQQTEDTSIYSTTNSLRYTCCTHSQEGNEIYRLQKCECLHASSLNLAPPAIKMSACTCLWGVWGSCFPTYSVKCWMHCHQQVNTEANLFMCHLQCIFFPWFGHLWKDVVFINSQHFTHFTAWKPNSTSTEHVLIQVVLTGHDKMAVFDLKHSVSAAAARALGCKDRWFWVGVKTRSGFI